MPLFRRFSHVNNVNSSFAEDRWQADGRPILPFIVAVSGVLSSYTMLELHERKESRVEPPNSPVLAPSKSRWSPLLYIHVCTRSQLMAGQNYLLVSGAHLLPSSARRNLAAKSAYTLFGLDNDLRQCFSTDEECIENCLWPVRYDEGYAGDIYLSMRSFCYWKTVMFHQRNIGSHGNGRKRIEG